MCPRRWLWLLAALQGGTARAGWFSDPEPDGDGAAEQAEGPAAAGAGGWDGMRLEQLDGGSLCTIERVPHTELDAARFASQYYGRRPVVLAGGATAAQWPRAFDRWRKEQLLADYGAREILVRVAGSSCLTDNADCVPSDGKRELPLRDYLGSMRGAPPSASLESADEGAAVPYTHDRHFLKQALPELRDDFTTPPAFCEATPLPCGPDDPEPGASEDPLFFLGAAGSGVGFHRHGHAWNSVVFGRKRWFLYPPTFTHDTVDLTLSTTE